MKERMKKVTALCLAAALSVGTILPVHAETVQDAQNAVDQLQQQKDSVQAEKTTVETELKKIAEEMEKTVQAGCKAGGDHRSRRKSGAG